MRYPVGEGYSRCFSKLTRTGKVFREINNMLDRFKDKMLEYEKVARQESEALELKLREKFDDPIAKRADWHHLNKGSGSSSQDKKLTSVSGDRLRVVNTLGGMTIPLLGAFGGIALIWIAIDSYFQIISSGGEPISAKAFAFLLGVGILIMGPAFLVLRPRNTLTFDKSAGYFWRGRKKPSGDPENGDLFGLERIEGLQIPPRKHVQFRNNNQDRSFYSYELNLIMDDNERINLMDHGDLVDIRTDAKKLSQYLNVPLFDASI